MIDPETRAAVEALREQESLLRLRLECMAEDTDSVWNLSENDKAALRWALVQIGQGQQAGAAQAVEANERAAVTAETLAILFYGDTGSTSQWRQCRVCGGYAEGPPNSDPYGHRTNCAVVQIAAAIRALRADRPKEL